MVDRGVDRNYLFYLAAVRDLRAAVDDLKDVVSDYRSWEFVNRVDLLIADLELVASDSQVNRGRVVGGSSRPVDVGKSRLGSYVDRLFDGSDRLLDDFGKGGRGGF